MTDQRRLRGHDSKMQHGIFSSIEDRQKTLDEKTENPNKVCNLLNSIIPMLLS